MPKMDETTLGDILDNEIAQTVGYGTGGDDITEAREKALEYYLGEPFGNEQEGRSSVISSDVQDVIESLLPGTVKVFVSADDVVEFTPENEEDEKPAKQATDLVNHIFMKENRGFDIIYTWQKDAFLQKNGFVKAAWVEEEVRRRSRHRLDYKSFVELVGDDDVEVEAVTVYLGENEIEEAPVGTMELLKQQFQYDVEITRTEKRAGVQIMNLPPENVLISRNAVSAQKARLIGHKERKTISEMLEEGFSAKELEDIPTASEDTSPEAQQRVEAQSGNMDIDSSRDPSTREIWVSEVFVRVDYDGDGIAELRKIIRAGDLTTGGKILENEEVDEIDIFSFTPIPMPHQVFGISLADLTMPVQLVKSTLQRQILDNIYRTNFPRWLLDRNLTDETTIDQLLSDEPGGYIEANGQGAVTPLVSQPLSAEAYQMLEYQDRVRELRTPVTRQSQGVDPNILNKTATEASIQANASEERKELILRLFADALGDLFKHILKLTIKYQDKPKTIRLRNEWVEIDPRHWNAEMDITVNVGLGTGTKEQRAAALINLYQLQLQLEETGLVTPKEIYQTASRYVEMIGLQNPSLYFVDPAPEEGEQKQPAPLPEEQLAAAMEEGRKQAETEIEAAKLQSKERIEFGKLESKQLVEAMKIAAKDADPEVIKRVETLAGDLDKMALILDMGDRGARALIDG